MTVVFFLPRARREQYDAADFYERARPGLGREFLDDVQRAVDHLARMPEGGSRVHGRTRRLPLSRFPFWLLYRAYAERNVIAAVAHQRRRPGYWRS